MATHDRNLLKRADIERFQAWLNENKLAWRPGKGEFQLMQVQVQDGWPAICVSTKGVVSTPPTLRKMIDHFHKGLPYASKAPRKPADGADFINDLRDDFAMAAMQGLLQGEGLKPLIQKSVNVSRVVDPGYDLLARKAYSIAEAMLAERAERLKA